MNSPIIISVIASLATAVVFILASKISNRRLVPIIIAMGIAVLSPQSFAEYTQEQKDAAKAIREGDIDKAAKHMKKDLANKPKRKFETPEEEAAAKAMSAGDYKTAVKYLKPLAEKGHVGAQNQLGMNYQYGWGVPKDYKQSARYYAMAAEQGHAVAQRSLALEYLKGRGTKKDLVEAYKWYTLAARTSKTSERFRQSTERRLTPAQIADGKARVKKWLAAHPGK